MGLSAVEVRERFENFAGEKATIYSSGNLIAANDVHMLRNADKQGISTAQDAICTGFNSGYQIVNIASLAGATKIVLLGYDAKEGAKKRKHFFGDHPDNSAAPYEAMRRSFRLARPLLTALGVTVINATPGSALDAFDRMPLDEAIQ